MPMKRVVSAGPTSRLGQGTKNHAPLTSVCIQVAFGALLIATCPHGAGAQVPSSTFGSPLVIGTSRQTATSGTSLDLGSVTDSMLLPIGTTGQEPSPAVAGMIRWNSTTLQAEVYNGGAWAPLWQTPLTATETAPAGTGFFVVSGTTWNGNLGGRVGADALCLTEIATTNTGWLGYATALGRGLLVSAKVHAFVCDGSVCNNLMPLTIYRFASASDGTAGGSIFTTDASGDGPQDSANWSDAVHFKASYSYWTGRAAGTATVWGPGIVAGSNCNGFTSSAASVVVGEDGTSNSTTKTRWNSAAPACSSTLNLICFVNP